MKEQALKTCTAYACYVDASWISQEHQAGIAWSLLTKQGACVLQGSSSIQPLQSPLEAEAVALRMAVQEVSTKLNFQNVTFMGDCKAVYSCLENKTRAQNEVWCPTSLEIFEICPSQI